MVRVQAKTIIVTNLGGGAAGDDGLEFPSGAQAAAEILVENQLAEGRFPDFNFVIAGLPDMAADADDAGTGVV